MKKILALLGCLVLVGCIGGHEECEYDVFDLAVVTNNNPEKLEFNFRVDQNGCYDRYTFDITKCWFAYHQMTLESNEFKVQVVDRVSTEDYVPNSWFNSVCDDPGIGENKYIKNRLFFPQEFIDSVTMCLTDDRMYFIYPDGESCPLGSVEVTEGYDLKAEAEADEKSLDQVKEEK